MTFCYRQVVGRNIKTGAIIVLLMSLAGIVWGQGRILISPNVLVSRDGDVAHVESHVAANPRNPRNLLGTAISFTSPAIGTETKVYASFDGGWAWTDRYFPDHRQQGAWDPQVAFGVTGTAYLTTMVYTNNDSKYDAVAFYRSEDGGRIWSKPVYLGFNYDRNAIVVDNSHGRFRGRVYVSSHRTVNGVGIAHLFRSADDGRTFQGPLNTHCQTVNYLLTLSDGTLWIPCLPETASKHSGDRDAQGPSYGARMSVDGGKSLTAFVGTPIVTGDSWQAGSEVYAVDTTEYFRDRIYVLWPEGEGDKGGAHVMLSYSTDRGLTWRAQRVVAPVSRAGARQYLPMVAVNRGGVLGIIWFEKLDHADAMYDVFFTASLDGGDSFLPPRRVTSHSSQADSPQNRALTQIGGIRKKGLSHFFSAYSRWKNAGEYTGLTADTEGVFHAFWPDARRGAFQLYTSRITVKTNATDAIQPLSSEAALPVDQEVNVEFGPAMMRHTGLDEVIAVRLRNVSTHAIWGPLTVTVTATLSGLGGLLDTTYNPNIIFDPEARRWSKQARIDYSPALRDIPFLAPGEATEAIEWRFRNASQGQLNLITQVYAGRKTEMASARLAALRQ